MGLGFGVEGGGFRIMGRGLRDMRLGLGVEVSGFRIMGFVFRVLGYAARVVLKCGTYHVALQILSPQVP